MIEKIKEIKLRKDIYFCEAVTNKIIVNDNYSGILIYSDDLKPEKKISLLNDLIIENSFVNHIKKSILLFCGENRKCIYIDLENDKIQIIDINFNTENIFLSKIFEWDKDIILSTFNNEFFKIDIKDNKIIKIDIENVKKNYCDFFNIYNVYLELLTKSAIADFVKVGLENKLIVFDNKSYDLRSVKNNNPSNYSIETINLDFDINYYDIIYDNNLVAFVDENIIEIFNNEHKHSIALCNKYIFRKLCFIHKNNITYLVLLISDKADEMNSRIVKYKIF